jgi:hypothetical protein
MMIPTILVPEARFAEVAQRVVEHGSPGDGVRFAQLCFLEEVLGAVFGSITLWYLVSSIASLA